MAGCFLSSLFSVYASGFCQVQDLGGSPETVRVSNVYDGDTLTLSDGRKVRLLGINAPEVSGQAGAEPIAVTARDQLRSLAERQTLYLVMGEESQDHYGRTLAHLFDRAGNSITARLLQEGAGFQVVFPPNVRLSECYRQAQDQARADRKGVWGHSYYAPQLATSRTVRAGYGLIAGKVEQVRLAKKTIWVELEGQLTLKLERQYADYLSGDLLDSLVGLSQGAHKPAIFIGAKGWLSDRSRWRGDMPKQVSRGQRKRFQLKVRHRLDWWPISAEQFEAMTNQAKPTPERLPEVISGSLGRMIRGNSLLRNLC